MIPPATLDAAARVAAYAAQRRIDLDPSLLASLRALDVTASESKPDAPDGDAALPGIRDLHLQDCTAA